MNYVKFINKDNLRIARENVGLSILTVSKRISRAKDNLASKWESGESLPTWSQVRKLAKFYCVSELLFFSSILIKENKIIPDYREGIDKQNEDNIKKLINLVIKRQEWLGKKFKADKAPKNDLQGIGQNIQQPEKLADFIKEKLKISVEEIKNITGTKARKKTLDYLISKVEERGVFVGKTISFYNIGVEEMRGLFISNDYCPFIILNRKDALSAQIFSFVHELAHLFRKTDAISNSLDFRQSLGNINNEEIFCNKVAAELLLPKSEITKEFYDKSDIDYMSKVYKVSRLFVFYRLKDLNKIRKSQQINLEDEIKKETQENILRKNRNKKAKGGNYTNNMRDSNGKLFNNIVSNTYLENKISYVEASNLLKFSVEKI